MKKEIQKAAVCLALFLFTAIPSFSDDPAPPPPPAGHGYGGDQGPVGAPIDGGLGILLVMGATYGAKKYFDSRKGKTLSTDSERIY